MFKDAVEQNPLRVNEWPSDPGHCLATITDLTGEFGSCTRCLCLGQTKLLSCRFCDPEFDEGIYFFVFNRFGHLLRRGVSSSDGI